MVHRKCDNPCTKVSVLTLNLETFSMQDLLFFIKRIDLAGNKVGKTFR